MDWEDLIHMLKRIPQTMCGKRNREEGIAVQAEGNGNLDQAGDRGCREKWFGLKNTFQVKL